MLWIASHYSESFTKIFSMESKRRLPCGWLLFQPVLQYCPFLLICHDTQLTTSSSSYFKLLNLHLKKKNLVLSTLFSILDDFKKWTQRLNKATTLDYSRISCDKNVWSLSISESLKPDLWEQQSRAPYDCRNLAVWFFFSSLKVYRGKTYSILSEIFYVRDNILRAIF